MDGGIVGINTAIYSRSGGSMGLGFSIPSEMVATVIAAEKSGAITGNGVARQEFRTRFSREILSPRTLLIIISDACDSNTPEELAHELSALSQKCKRIFWLNPMLERAGVDPFSPDLENIREHVDELLPAHSLSALYRLAMAIRGHRVSDSGYHREP